MQKKLIVIVCNKGAKPSRALALRNVVKAFYTAGVIFDVCETFGELSVEVQEQRKYAKWKAAYIHNCLKSGEQPQPGPVGGGDGGWHRYRD